MAANQVTHMVDPWSRASGNRNLAFNGERMQGAVERHRRHTIIRPVSSVTVGSESQPQPPPPLTTEEVSGLAPNGQAAFLFLLTSTLAPLIHLSYMRMVIMALPYTIVLTATGLLAVIYLL